MTRRLWDKGGALDAELHDFTVGDDPTLDLQLIEWDCLASAAHARTLEKAGLLSNEECRALIRELAAIREDARAGRFIIPRELEDGHTAIEARLTEKVRPAGGKIHTGRSRNDQVAVAMRLFMRSRALSWFEQLDGWINALLSRFEADGATPMPGYTHMQPAMPSSVGQWLFAFVEAAIEQQRAIIHLLDMLDCCPLGTGAGFGVDLPLDRGFTARLLGFSRVQWSPIDVQNSRGRMELYFTRVATDIGRAVERFASDLLLFSSRAYGFFSLPDALTTGSSIMPQKRNPDVLELLRGRAAALRATVIELELVTLRLSSSYHRDLQLTKAPALRAAEEAELLCSVATRVTGSFKINEAALRAAMVPELYATAAAYRLVREGVPFREAYRTVAARLTEGGFDVDAALASTASSNLTPNLPALRLHRTDIERAFGPRRDRHSTAVQVLRYS